MAWIYMPDGWEAMQIQKDAICPRRRSINRAKHRIEALARRGARNRRIQRAGNTLAKRETAEAARKARLAAK